MAITPETTHKELAIIVCSHLQKHGIEAVLTGGAVVSIYAGSTYKSYDLDFITWATNKAIQKAMRALGFTKDAGRYYVHQNTDFMWNSLPHHFPLEINRFIPGTT